MTFASTASDLLDAVVAALPSPVVRAYVSHGPPAWDLCSEDQATVHLGPVSLRQPPNGRCGAAPQVGMVVQVVRCHPTLDDQGQPPSEADLTAAASALADDLEAVIAAVVDQAGDLFGDCSAVIYQPATTLGPTGAVAGWSWPLVVTIG